MRTFDEARRSGRVAEEVDGVTVELEPVRGEVPDVPWSSGAIAVFASGDGRPMGFVDRDGQALRAWPFPPETSWASDGLESAVLSLIEYSVRRS